MLSSYEVAESRKIDASIATYINVELLLIRITSGLILINIKLRSNEERRADRQATYAPLDKLL